MDSDAQTTVSVVIPVHNESDYVADALEELFEELDDVPASITVLAAENGGQFPREMVKSSIDGETLIVAHGTKEMPVWGDLLMELRPDWNPARRADYTEQRIRTLTDFVESLQAE